MDMIRLASQHPLLFVKSIECILEDFVIISADVSDHCSVGSMSCHTTKTTRITTTAEQARHGKEYLKGYILADGTEIFLRQVQPDSTQYNV
jgi:hypothetical protein